MLPQPNQQSQPQSSGGGGRRNRQNNRLTAEYLLSIGASTTAFKDAKILAAQAESNNKYGPQVVCKIAVHGEIKFWNLDINRNPNYTELLQRFGPDENDWADKKILLGVSEPNFYNQQWPQVDFPEEKKSARK